MTNRINENEEIRNANAKAREDKQVASAEAAAVKAKAEEKLKKAREKQKAREERQQLKAREERQSTSEINKANKSMRSNLYRTKVANNRSKAQAELGTGATKAATVSNLRKTQAATAKNYSTAIKKMQSAAINNQKKRANLQKASTEYDMSVVEIISESCMFGLNEDYYRIDHGKVPTTFSSNQFHGHDDDSNEITGVYASHKKHAMGHVYAVPREVPWVFHHNNDGQKNLYIHKDHKDKVENHSATLSKFHKSNGFRGIDGSDEENVSKKNERPHSQTKIDSADHIRKQGIKIHYVDSNKLKQKANQTHTDKGKTFKAAGNENINEDMYFKVKIEGLPTMYVNSANREELRKDLVGLLRNPSKAVGDIKRVTPQEVKKRLRLRSQGKEEEEMNEAQSDGYYMMTQAKKSAASAGEDYNDRRVADRHTAKVAKKMGYTHKDYASGTYYKSRMPGSRLIESIEINETYIKFDHPKLKYISKGFMGRKEAERHNDHLYGKKKASGKSYVLKHKDNKFYVVDIKESVEINEDTIINENIYNMLINEGYSAEEIQYIIDEGMWDDIKSKVKAGASNISKTVSNVASNIRRKVMNPDKSSLLSKARTKLNLNAKPKPTVKKPTPKPKPKLQNRRGFTPGKQAPENRLKNQRSNMTTAKPAPAFKPKPIPKNVSSGAANIIRKVQARQAARAAAKESVNEARTLPQIVSVVRDGIVRSIPSQDLESHEGMGWRHIVNPDDHKGIQAKQTRRAESMDCWDGYKKQGTKPGTGKNKGQQVNNCVPEAVSDIMSKLKDHYT